MTYAEMIALPDSYGASDLENDENDGSTDENAPPTPRPSLIKHQPSSLHRQCTTSISITAIPILLQGQTAMKLTSLSTCKVLPDTPLWNHQVRPWQRRLKP